MSSAIILTIFVIFKEKVDFLLFNMNYNEPCKCCYYFDNSCKYYKFDLFKNILLHYPSHVFTDKINNDNRKMHLSV